LKTICDLDFSLATEGEWFCEAKIDEIVRNGD